jgi:hypothetical protein
MMDRKGMEQHERRTASQHLVGNLGVATLDVDHPLVENRKNAVS